MQDKLSLREEEIMELVSKGMTNKEIAQTLKIAVTTVKTHLHNIYAKYLLFADSKPDYSVIRLKAVLIYLRILI